MVTFDPTSPVVQPVQLESTIPGFNKIDFGGITFDLPTKYQAIKLIGKGTYGSVISANNLETNEKVAIKKLAHIEDVVSWTAGLGFGSKSRAWANWFNFLQVDAKRVLREIIIMKNLQHENILGLLDVVYVSKDGQE